MHKWAVWQTNNIKNPTFTTRYGLDLFKELLELVAYKNGECYAYESFDFYYYVLKNGEVVWDESKYIQ